MRVFSRLMLAIAIVLAIVSTQVDWRLWARAATYPENEATQVNWYQPLESIAGGNPKALPQNQETTIPDQALADVTAYAKSHNSRALLVLEDDDLVLENYWHGFNAKALANGMSMTKTIVGLLIGIAIDEGSIHSVSDPIQTYLPDWQYNQRWRELKTGNPPEITLEDLLYMQSGLRNDDDTTNPFSDLVQMYLSSDVAAAALQVPPEQPPGKVYEYNNVNTQILSLVLEHATGESFGEYLSSRLWQPLQASEAATWLDRPGGESKTFCCLFANPYDWARVGLLLLHEGKVGQNQIVPRDWIRKMLQPTPIEPTFGYHIWIKARTPGYSNVDTAASEPFLAEDTFYLDGRGFQRVYVIPSRNLVVVRLGEQPPNWDDAVIPNTLVRGMTS
ncbi:serine hydrolase [filamentous cyanobacterium CCP5]|nr:serine hydrolase [filamentous cyanobacterium CCT1]PSN17178.1 serine hydrolase [filamentous cyanobacterium CCP5]